MDEWAAVHTGYEVQIDNGTRHVGGEYHSLWRNTSKTLDGSISKSASWTEHSFRPKKGRLVGKAERGKGTTIMSIADGHGLPLALRTESASPAEVTLVEKTLEERAIADVPEQLMGDEVYDSDGLDKKLMENYGTEMIAANKNNRRIKIQDGRPLRRFVRRWKIERLFAWLFNFRRLVVRYEYHAENFQGFIHLAAAIYEMALSLPWCLQEQACAVRFEYRDFQTVSGCVR